MKVLGFLEKATTQRFIKPHHKVFRFVRILIINRKTRRRILYALSAPLIMLIQLRIHKAQPAKRGSQNKCINFYYSSPAIQNSSAIPHNKDSQWAHWSGKMAQNIFDQF
jgi:hypothetical protein